MHPRHRGRARNTRGRRRRPSTRARRSSRRAPPSWTLPLSSVESQAAATSAASRSQVRAWDQAHGPVFTTLQTDISKVNAAFPASEASDYSSVDPSWQQLLSDAQSAMKLPPIPDPLIQSYWSTALNDLIQGSSDCLGLVGGPSPQPLRPGCRL